MSQVSEEIKTLLIQYAIKSVMEKLVVLTGFFALPVINPVTLYIVTQLVTYLVNETALGLSLLWISLNISYEVSSVESATNALKQMLDNPKGYSNDQQTQIEANFDTAARDLIRISLTRL